MKERNVHFMSNDQTWETPIDFYNELNKEFGFTLDPCCSLKTAKCEMTVSAYIRYVLILKK